MLIILASTVSTYWHVGFILDAVADRVTGAGLDPNGNCYYLYFFFVDIVANACRDIRVAKGRITVYGVPLPLFG